MLLGLVLLGMLFVWVLTSQVLTRTFEQAGRAVVADDLGEYGALYERLGIEGVRQVFTAGRHESDQFLRIIAPSGETWMDSLPSTAPALAWPDLATAPAPRSPGETVWHRSVLPAGPTLIIGCRKLSDGAELWFGRTNLSDEMAIARVHLAIVLTVLITAVFAIAPVVWFSGRVLRPVHAFGLKAQRLAREGTEFERLDAAGAIPELQHLAATFNESLDRIQSLTRELEAANDQLAHELRTPLARIRGNIEHILAHAETGTSRDSAVRALEEIDRATRLISAILSIRAGDARCLKLQLEPVSLEHLLAETCDLYLPAAEEKGLRLVCQLPSGPMRMAADPERLQQAFCNLLDNAVAYTPPGGEIRVELQAEPQHAVIRICDTGPGLSEADLASIWRRFVRGSAASASVPGIGLGLSLVKAVASAHQGEVGARNREIGGAEFWIRLPCTSPEQVAAGVPLPAPSATSDEGAGI